MHNYNKLHEIVREHETARYDNLLEKYHALRLQGAEPSIPVPQYTPMKSEPFDEMKALIADISGSDLRKRAMMLRQLAQDRADGVPAEEIETRIRTGVQAEGVPV
jgi:hypothetical protein